MAPQPQLLLYGAVVMVGVLHTSPITGRRSSRLRGSAAGRRLRRRAPQSSPGWGTSARHW